MENEQIAEANDDALEPIDESIVDDWDKDKVLARIKSRNQELKALRERAKAAEDKVAELDDVLTQVQTLETSNQDLSQAKESLVAELTRYKVAIDKGLPKTLITRLNGSTREELESDAESLLDLFPSPNPVPTNRPAEFRGGSTPNDPKRSTAEQFADFFEANLKS